MAEQNIQPIAKGGKETMKALTQSLKTIITFLACISSIATPEISKAQQLPSDNKYKTTINNLNRIFECSGDVIEITNELSDRKSEIYKSAKYGQAPNENKIIIFNEDISLYNSQLIFLHLNNDQYQYYDNFNGIIYGLFKGDPEYLIKKFKLKKYTRKDEKESIQIGEYQIAKPLQVPIENREKENDKCPMMLGLSPLKGNAGHFLFGCGWCDG